MLMKAGSLILQIYHQVDVHRVVKGPVCDVSVAYGEGPGSLLQDRQLRLVVLVVIVICWLGHWVRAD